MASDDAALEGLAHAARRLEEIEDELAQVDGMEDFRERITNVRVDLVGMGMGIDEAFGDSARGSE